MNTAWMMLTVAGLLEVGWSIGLKYTDGFNFRGRPLACSATLLAMVASMYLLSLAVRSIPIGTGYAIWTGIGALGAATIGMLFFREPATAARIGCVLLIVAGIVGLKLTSTVAAAEPATSPATHPGANVIHFYIGSSDGVGLATLDLESARLSEVVSVAHSKGATFIALHPKLHVLYAVAEGSPGKVRAFRIGADRGLTLMNEVSSQGNGPCHVSVTQDGKLAFVANYGSGSVAALPISADGALGEASFVDQHAGTSANAQRQAGPHAHCLQPGPTGRFALSADLGTDEITTYRIDGTKVSRVSSTKTSPGLGPRMLTFSADGKRVYVVTELLNTVETYRRDLESGELTFIDSVPTLPKDVTIESAAAGIGLNPDGRFLYTSNRGHDTIAVFAIDQSSGRVTPVADTPCNGRGSRHFNIDPSGRFMIVANTKSDTIDVFAIDLATGKLTATGASAKVASPACIAFVKVD